jgi:hypothetical protein
MPLLLKALLGSLVFTALGAALLLYTDVPRFVGWANICFFGLGGLAVLSKQVYVLVARKTTLVRQQERALSNTVRRMTGSTMGADAFVAFYGIKVPLDPDDEETLDACGMETDPRCVAAKRAGLQTHSGRMTNGEDYFLYLGIRFAWLGLEHDQYMNVSRQQLMETISDVQTKLKTAGFEQLPSLHLQFVGQY